MDSKTCQGDEENTENSGTSEDRWALCFPPNNTKCFPCVGFKEEELKVDTAIKTGVCSASLGFSEH